MSLASIYAILALLSAFGVPRPTVDTVQGILLKSNSPIVMTAPTESIGGVGTMVQDCTPILESSATWVDGTVDTGMDYVFNATSTYPVSCEVDRSTIVTLQTPSVTYKGTIGSWAESDHGTVKDNQFIYRQGFGFNIGKNPIGDLTWSVGSQTSRVTLK